MKTLHFWYDFASTYSYLAAMRIGSLAEQHGVKVHWCPFLLGPIFQKQGLSTSPFNVHPAKGAYMLRDMQRLAEEQRLPFSWPQQIDGSDGFPRRSILASRVALVGVAAGWGEIFTRSAFLAEFGNSKDISDADVVTQLLSGIGLDPAPILKEAETPDIKSKLRVNTDDAMALGVFGAPSFTIDSELFWGNDRLEAALNYAKAAS